MTPVINKHKVPAKQWNKWGSRAKEVFNSYYDSMMNQPDLYNHPKAVINKTYWKRTCWNCAWIAAAEVQTALNTIYNEVKYLTKV